MKMKKTLKFLHYVASRPDAILVYGTSNMMLNIRSGAPYLSPKAKNRTGGHFCMSNNGTVSENNGAVLTGIQL
jgi:hypothetical protein